MRAVDVGTEVTLLGWVHRVRDLGGVLFIDVRDRGGITQVVVGDALLGAAKRLRAEYVVGVTGDSIVTEAPSQVMRPRIRVEVGVACSAPQAAALASLR